VASNILVDLELGLHCFDIAFQKLPSDSRDSTSHAQCSFVILSLISAAGFPKEPQLTSDRRIHLSRPGMYESIPTGKYKAVAPVLPFCSYPVPVCATQVRYMTYRLVPFGTS